MTLRGFLRLLSSLTPGSHTDELLAVFREVDSHLKRSTDSDWSYLSVDEARKIIAGATDRIRRAGEPDRSELSLLFAPTGPLQEIAVDNGWGTAYYRLAGRFDLAIR